MVCYKSILFHAQIYEAKLLSDLFDNMSSVQNGTNFKMMFLQSHIAHFISQMKRI